MDMVKLNSKLTKQVVSFIEIMQSYQDIEQTSEFYVYHRENETEILYIDFRLKIIDTGLVISIDKTYDKNTSSGGHYVENTQAEIDVNSLETWLQDNGIYSKQIHNIANKLYNTVLCITSWDIMENDFYSKLYTEYEKYSCETKIAIEILLEKLSDLTDRYYVQKVWLEIQMNEEKINNLF